MAAYSVTDGSGIPFYQWAKGVAADAPTSYWAPIATGKFLEDMILGEGYARIFLEELAKGLPPHHLAEIVRSVATLPAKRSKQLQWVTAGFFNEVGRALRAQT